MSNLENDINRAKILINNNRKNNYNINFDMIYPFTNESIKECFKHFDLNNKDCLTVLSSSDQVFDMILGGAKKIDTFDINPLTIYYFNLKSAFLKSNLSRSDYLNYFSNIGSCENTFNYKIFDKICINLDNDSYKFWTRLYNEFEPYEIRKSNGLFNEDEDPKTMLISYINYLNSDEKFNKLKEIIYDVKFSFKIGNVNDLLLNFKDKYDFIYLSNIIQYADEMYENISISTTRNQIYKLEKYKSLVESLSKNILKKDGNIVAGYIYNPDYSWNNPAIFNNDIRNIVFNDKNFTYKYFRSVNDEYFKSLKSATPDEISYEEKDACLVYKK